MPQEAQELSISIDYQLWFENKIDCFGIKNTKKDFTCKREFRRALQWWKMHATIMKTKHLDPQSMSECENISCESQQNE